MEISPTRNLTQQLVHELGVAIAQGAYSCEKGMPSEADICQQYEISRSATREAVKMLTAKGLLSSRPRQGIRIQPRTNWNLFDTDVLSWILSEAPSMAMLKDFLQVRLAFEPEAAALAATNANRDKISEIEAALRLPQASSQHAGELLGADIAFHSTILAATDNPFYVQLTSFIESSLKAGAHFSQLRGINGSEYAEKRAIYEAIASGQAEEARSVFRHMLLSTIESLEIAIKTNAFEEPLTGNG